jgi:general secretion pathway protein C
MRASIAMLALSLLAGCGSANPPVRSSEITASPAQPDSADLAARVDALEERVRALESRQTEPPPIVERPVDRPAPGDPELVGEHHYRVPRAFFEALTASPNETMREARVVPVTKNNQVVGLRLFGIRPDSRLARLGLKNGDQLQTLNDIPLTTPDKALKAYAASRNADTLRVTLIRQGQSIDFRYDLVAGP